MTITELEKALQAAWQNLYDSSDTFGIQGDREVCCIEEDLIEKAKALEAKVEALQKLCDDLFYMAANGDYHNGVTDESGHTDEGDVQAHHTLCDFEARLKELSK